MIVEIDFLLLSSWKVPLPLAMMMKNYHFVFCRVDKKIYFIPELNRLQNEKPFLKLKIYHFIIKSDFIDKTEVFYRLVFFSKSISYG